MTEEMTGTEQITQLPEDVIQALESISETFGVTCPLCGGSLRVREGERSVLCRYCNSALYVTRPSGVKSFTMNPKTTAGKARLTALHYIAEETNGRIKSRHASIIDQQLIHVPFWRMHGRLMGWVCGDKVVSKEIEVTSQVPGGRPVVRKTIREERFPYSKLVFKRVDWSAPACVLRELGLQGISLRTGFLEWEIFDHELKKKQNIALPMKGIRQVRKDAFNYLTRLVTPTGATVRASRFHLFDSNFSLYYYPVYLLRYRHHQRIYTITIDANDGRVIRGETPKLKDFDAKNFFFIPAAFAFLAGTYLPLAFIAAGIVYLMDLLQTEGFLPPHKWLVGRLNRWFGSDQ